MPGERCPVCMKPLDAGAAKCPHCGAPVPCAPKQGEPLATAYIRTDAAGPARYDISEGSYPKTEQIDPPRPSPVTETVRIETQQKSRIDELPVRAKKKSKAPLAILLAGLAVLVIAAVLILVLDPFNPGEKNHVTPIKADVLTPDEENVISTAEPPEAEEAGEIAENAETPPAKTDEPEEDGETGPALIIQAETEQEEETGTPTAGTVHVGGVQIGQGYRSTPTPTPTPQTADTPTHSPTPVPTRIPMTTPTPTPVTGGTGGGNQQGGSRLDNIRANRRLYMTTKGKKACFVEVETAASVTKIRIVYPGNEVYRESTMPAATDTGSAYPKKWKIEISFFSKETRNQVSGTYTIIYYTGDDQYEEEVVWGGL